MFTALSFGPFALLRHVGRRSGKSYETVIMVWPTQEGFVITLTYGTAVDWYRNLLTAGGGNVFWHRKSYRIGRLESMDAQVALHAFPVLFRFILSRSGLRDFIRVPFILPEPTS